MMFTGIVAAVGNIRSVQAVAGGARVAVACGALDLSDVAVGDSIAVNGACMTVIAKDAAEFSFDISAESLARTTGLDQPGPVNLEKALRLGDALGGHLVSGHVDGVGTVAGLHPAGTSFELVIVAPPGLAACLAYKGSVAVDGVSLTVNRVTDLADGSAEISINLIPHTLAATTLAELRAGSRVNLEVDLIARYTARYLEARHAGAAPP